MPNTPLCDLFGIDVPIIPAPMGHLHLSGVCGCRVQRRGSRGHRNALPTHRRRQARHRHGEAADDPALCDQPYSANIGRRGVSLHAGGTARCGLLRACRSRRSGAAGPRCRLPRYVAGHDGCTSRPSGRARCRRDHRVGRRGGRLLWRGQYHDARTASRRRGVAHSHPCGLRHLQRALSESLLSVHVSRQGRSRRAKAALCWRWRNPRRSSMGFARESQVRTGLSAGGGSQKRTRL